MNTEKTTVIYNNTYIDELTRHRDIWKKRYEVEHMPDLKVKYQRKYEILENKLEDALEYQDKLDSVMYVDVPQITVIKTMSGDEIPAKYVQLI